MGNLVKFFIIGIASLSLSSCIEYETSQQPVPENFSLYRSENGYAVAVPLGYTYSEPAPSGKYYYFGYPNTDPQGMSSIEFYPVTTCSSTLTGASQTTSIPNTNGTTGWGRVDYFDTMGYLFEGTAANDVLCRPPAFVFDEYEQKTGSAQAYAFCSEKDGKTVLICISQVTDNPELAEQIFSTFQWKD